jgi:carbohydrate-selective porin OprB
MFLVFMMGSTLPCFGDELDNRIDARLKQKFPLVSIMEDLEMGIGITSILQSTHNANGETNNDAVDASYSFDLTLLKTFDEHSQTFLHFEQGNGLGVTDELMLFSNVNADANPDESIKIAQAWYEHSFSPKDLDLVLTIGKIDPTSYIDDNAYANDETTQFLGDMFKKSPAIEFPDNAFGVRLDFEISDSADMNFVLLDANADWEDVLEDPFLAGQITVKPKILDRDGNYRVIVWINDREHAKWNSLKHHEINYGFGFNIDQEVTDTVGVFARYGWQNSKVYLSSEDFSIEHAYSLGAQMAGNEWDRKDDVVAIAIGQIIPSDKYKDATSRKAKTETHVETYYNCKIADYLCISPDLQVIFNPYGKDATNGDNTIVVAGIRAQLDF